MKKLTVMVDEEVLAQWREAAYIRRVSLSEWVRQVLTATAKATVEK